MESLEPVAFVQNTSCFSEENFAKLREIMYEQHIPSGSSLFWEGDPADKLFFIQKGCVKITKSTNEGKEYVLYLFHKGDLLGQLDPYQDSRQSFHAKAVQDCEVGILQKNDLEILLWQHGDLAIEFMKWMGLMHRMTQTKFRDLMLYGKPGALCSTLIRLANTYGRQGEKGLTLSKKFTNAELADYIGAARESVNRMLNNLKKANAIDFEDGYITIINLDYLKGICFCEDCPLPICRI
jgi:CRP/FNR family transcriptional regulator